MKILQSASCFIELISFERAIAQYLVHSREVELVNMMKSCSGGLSRAFGRSVMVLPSVMAAKINIKILQSTSCSIELISFERAIEQYLIHSREVEL
ncbi:hypothetical protein CEXT_559301 [Caerostris extrusa]|uniref:Uncharacterized protein n=1 Tax=Caerostris extrusa TaxID=172846 RepID=A0AAV4UWT0_CAEEX|nr:hypothetical protein CEXT_559301 [Caerostris extrusa]